MLLAPTETTHQELVVSHYAQWFGKGMHASLRRSEARSSGIMNASPFMLSHQAHRRPNVPHGHVLCARGVVWLENAKNLHGANRSVANR